MSKMYVLLVLGGLTLTACGGYNSTPAKDWAVVPEYSEKSTLLEAVVGQGVPRALATLAFSKFDFFIESVARREHMGIIDFTIFSGQPRFYLIDTTTGKVDFLHVAHGEGSDPRGTGSPITFSNIPDSHMSSTGSYIVAETYQMKGHGTAARMDGLESTNSLARPRGIVLHSATYVSKSLPKMGMSWGCPAVSLDVIKDVLKRMVGGGFLYAFGTHQTKPIHLLPDPVYIWTDESLAPASGEWGM